MADSKPQSQEIQDETVKLGNPDTASTQQSHTFIKPKREILEALDMERWEKSEAYQDYMGFVLTLSKAVEGKKMTTELSNSQAIESLLTMLETMDTWVQEFPPINQPQRFGNKAYRDWFQKMEESIESFVKPLVPENYTGAEIELVAYLKDAFGNKTRIDYGTGHEASFGIFLCCLFKLQVLNEKDYETVVFKVFDRYLKLLRNLQTVYRMEPAGSQGVWGLDDFQFLPFIWGSAQLIGHQKLSPKSITDKAMCEHFCKDYLIFECINFINKVKTGPFAEHSNTLWGISSVPNWNKVNSGLIKMYKAEVLAKYPVIQHFVFGSIMSIKPCSPFKKPL